MKPQGETDSLVFSAESAPYGVGYAEWTARWWQWILSIPNEDNPAKDDIGKHCSLNQTGPVWFLAGTVGGAARRNCIIPSDLAVLLPILNHGGTLADEPTFKTAEELLLFAIKEMDLISDLEVSFDGVKVKESMIYRVQSPIFEVVLPENNLFGGVAGPTKGAADGYWLFLKPLSKGKHEIHSSGSCLAGRVNIGVDYDITVI